MSGYTNPCIFCKQEIRLSNDSGNWLPYNLDGSLHECRESVKGKDKPQQVKQEQLTITLEDLDLKLKTATMDLL